MKHHHSKLIALTIVAVAALMILVSGIPGGITRAMRTQPDARKTDDYANPDVILFARGALNTSQFRALDTAHQDSALPELLSEFVGSESRLRIIQFRAPIRRDWSDALKSTGSEVVGYLPNNAYIVRGTRDQIARVAALHGGAAADDARPIRWMGRFEPLQKIDARFDDGALEAPYGSAEVEIELVDSADSARAIEYINNNAVAMNREPRRFLKFIVISATIPIDRLLAIASFDEVLFVSRVSRIELHDERTAQIVASSLTPDGSAPEAPGYLEWLESKGLNTPSNALIDFTDTGLDRGSASSNFVHPDLLDNADNSRVAYYINYALDSPEDRRGHGSLVASIASGSGRSGEVDETGYLFGLGIDPYSRLGISRIFAETGHLPFNLRFSTVASAAYDSGARISNNSWGTGGGGYDAAAQEYDALTRDAQPAIPGNQEMLFVFSAGNGGSGSQVSAPGTAKNVLTVGASENFRPDGWDACNLDGMGAIGPEGANNALDMSGFSSPGPTSDGRSKPDIAAPGTHVFGSASQAAGFFASGICPGIPIFRPPTGQRLYTWSSGTSMAAPQVSGAASLAWRYFVLKNLLGDGQPPSPAMMKAFLTNSASYMTGENAGGNLPGDRQGWGLVNLSRAFDDTRRILVDQTRLFDDSGQTFEIRASIVDRTQPVRVTLAWTDAPGMLAGRVLSNDLDLELKIGDATVYLGNTFSGQFSVAGGPPDRANNIETIILSPDAIPQGAAGNITIVVRAANISSDGVPGNGIGLDQDFALVIYNVGDAIVDPPPPPPKAKPVVTNATYVKKVLTLVGRDFTAQAQVEINGKLINREFSYDALAGSLRLKLKSKKLNLKVGADNEIVLIEAGERSLPFILRL